MEETDNLQRLEKRIGRVHLRTRTGIETEHGADVFHIGANVFHLENWYSGHKIIRFILKLLRLHTRGVRNSLNITARSNAVTIPHLPKAFDGFTLLHLSDLHLDMHPEYPSALNRAIEQLDYDLCVITGDFRARTKGPIDDAISAMGAVITQIKAPTYAILGNHDSIFMLPALEDMGIQVLLNQSVAISRDNEKLWLAGIDDPHYFKMENFEKAADDIPAESASILLSHSPEPYQRAAHIGFDLMLSGHTHGGQICLPGGIALITNANAPRDYCAGKWRYGDMQGYTSVGSGSSIVDVRFNCPPEITLHRLSHNEAKGQ